ncbi:MAG: hypothetical protein ABI823_19170, partial [Bryobacteraceae bacterium]
INVQAPEDSSTGPVAIVVKNAKGESAGFSLTKAPLAPGLLAPSSFQFDGKQYAVATFSDGAFVCPPDRIAGVACRAAKPGDTVALYGVGFGAVTPVSAAGEIASGPTSLAAPISLRIGGIAAELPYAGLTPGTIGLYQFNVVIPEVADGEVEVEMTVGPVSQAPVPGRLFLLVRR